MPTNASTTARAPAVSSSAFLRRRGRSGAGGGALGGSLMRMTSRDIAELLVSHLQDGRIPAVKILDRCGDGGHLLKSAPSRCEFSRGRSGERVRPCHRPLVLRPASQLLTILRSAKSCSSC